MNVQEELQNKARLGLDISPLIENSVGAYNVIYIYFKINNLLNNHQEFMCENYFRLIDNNKMGTEKIRKINYLKLLVGEEVFIAECAKLIESIYIFKERFKKYLNLIHLTINPITPIELSSSLSDKKDKIISIASNYKDTYEDDFLFRFYEVFESMLHEFTSWAILRDKISIDTYTKWVKDYHSNVGYSSSIIYFYKDVSSETNLNFIYFEEFIDFLVENKYSLVRFLIKYSEKTSKYFV